MNPRLRLLDAALNRAREGLRVLEDVVRFSLDDAKEAAALKKMRHRLDRASRFLYAALVGARDSAGDVGREGDLPAEAGRPLDDVVAANIRRVQEALRSIEEGARGVYGPLSREAHRMRFEGYEWERRVGLRIRRRSLLEKVRLYVLYDPSTTPFRKIREGVEGGVQLIQLRMKKATTKERVGWVKRLKRLGVPVLVNDDVGAAGEADGVHLGENDLDPVAARALVGEGKIIGATSHNLAEAKRGMRAGADYVAVGPMFPTPLKPDLPAKGFRYLASARRMGIPVFCIGGITPDNLNRVIAAGGDRVAVCSAVTGAADPRRAARRIRRMYSRQKTL